MPYDFCDADAEVALLSALASIASEAADPRQAALGCLQACSESLGAASGFVALALRSDRSAPRLEVAAMVGPHSSLLGDPTSVAPVEQAEVTRAFTTGEPHFVGSLYNNGDAETSEGTARWRDLISAQATAVLPISTSTRSFGAMMLEWSSVQRFDEQLQRVLFAAARIVALAVERTWRDSDDADADEPATQGTPFVVGRPPALSEGTVAPGEVPVVPPAPRGDSPLRFELTAEGLVIPRPGDEPWGAGSVQVTMPATSQGGLLLDVHPVGSGRVLLAVASVGGASGQRQDELIDMVRQTARVLSSRAQAVAVLDAAAERLREFGGATMTLEGWIGVLDTANGSLSHAQSGRAGSKMLMADGRDFEGSSDAPSTWLPLSGDVLHAWVPGVASVRAEWR